MSYQANHFECVKCGRVIPETSVVCPNCGEIPDSGGSSKKESKKDFTHYNVIVVDPGPRKEIAGFIEDITEHSPQSVENGLKNLPWAIATRLSLQQAQELKVLLETNGAAIRLEGMDPWEDMPETNKTEEKPPTFSSAKKLLWGVVSVLFLVLTIYLFSIIARIGESGEKRFLSNLDPSIDLDRKETSAPASFFQDLPYSLAGEPESNDYNLRDDGANPYKNELVIRFDVPEETPLTITLLDKSFAPLSILLKATLEPDTYRLRWLGSLANNTTAPSGIYIIKLETTVNTYYRKIVWMAAKS